MHSLKLSLPNFDFKLSNGFTELKTFALGCKMYIPESSVRNNNNVYEEISIPATSHGPPDTGQLVTVDSMDEIGRIGFQVGGIGYRLIEFC